MDAWQFLNGWIILVIMSVLMGFGYHNVVIEINPTKNKKGQFFTTDPFLSEKCAENVDFIRELLTW